MAAYVSFSILLFMYFLTADYLTPAQTSPDRICPTQTLSLEAQGTGPNKPADQPGWALGPEDLEKVAAFGPAVIAWYQANKRALAWRTDPPDPYKVWLSEVMLQQTTVATATPYFERFLKAFPTVQVLSASSLDQVLHLWQGLGYYRRASHLHKAAQIVARQGFPRDYQGWLALPGVGPYTAGAITTIALGQPAVALDGNIFRILARYWGLDGPNWRALAQDYGQACLPPASSGLVYGDYTQGLMELGALVCRPQNPKCALCPLQGDCWARTCQAQDRLPLKAVRKRGVRTTHLFAWLRRVNAAESVDIQASRTDPEPIHGQKRQGKSGAEQGTLQIRLCNAPPHQLLKGLWGLPTSPWQSVTSPEAAPRAGKKASLPHIQTLDRQLSKVGPPAFGALDADPPGVDFQPQGWQPLGQVTHIFTHFTLHGQVWARFISDEAPFPEAGPSAVPWPLGTEWVAWDQLDSRPLSTLMRKALALVQDHLYTA